MLKTLIIVGPVPPPYHGVTISTRRLVESDLKNEFHLIHLDTSDHRNVNNIGAIDLVNFCLAFKSYITLFFYCFKYHPDLVYVPISQTFLGFFRDAFYIVIPKIIFRSRIIIHLRGGYFGTFYENSGFITKIFIRITMKFIDRVIVLGEALKPIFSRWFSPAQIDVVPNGTDLKIDGVENKLSLKNEEKYVTITFMSSLMRSKGIVDFILSAKEVLDKHKNTKFFVAGEWWRQEPELEREINDLMNEKDLGKNIVFLGLATGEAKNDLLLKTDIFILPTYYPFEGHPNVIIEAMAAGCAVIATDHAAIPETVIHGDSGLIVPAKNPQKLAEAIISLVENREMLNSMAKNSYERYKNFYTVEKSNNLLKQSFYRAVDPSHAH